MTNNDGHDPDTGVVPPPLAFVIMPFDVEFDLIYSQLIKTTLEQAGFSVRRADQLEFRNVMATIIQGLHDAELVVAEITTQNPNVMYELGIAHAMNKPTIMLTQDIDQVPFDLRSYRIVVYSPHFSQIGSLTSGLRDAASLRLRGELAWSSPVQDFAIHTHAFKDGGKAPPQDEGNESSFDGEHTSLTADADSEPDEVEYEGLIDLSVTIESSFDELNDGSASIAKSTQDLGSVFQERTSELQSALQHQGPGRNARILTIARATSSGVDAYVVELEAYVALLERLSPGITDSIVKMTEIARSSDRPLDSVDEVAGGLNTLADAIEGSCESLAPTLHGSD